MIMVVGRIREVSIFNCFIVDIGQTFKVDPLSISTLEMIMSSHLIIMCLGKVCPLPFGGSSSFVKEIWLAAKTIKTIPSNADFVAFVGTHVFFKTFKRALRWTPEDNGSAKIEI